MALNIPAARNFAQHVLSYGLILGASALLLTGCGKPPEAGKTDSKAASTTAAPADAKADAVPAKPTGTLNLYNWNNYIAPETVERFEKAYNAKVVQTFYSDNDEMLAKLAAGGSGYDIIVPTGNALQVMIRKDDLKPLDLGKLPNLKNIKPEFLNTPFDPGNKFSVPYVYGTTVLGYNDVQMKKAGLEVKGFDLIFDPKLACKIKNRITVLDSPDEVFSAAFIYLGIDPNTSSVADYKKAADTIRGAKGCWAAFNSSSYIKELSSGNIWLALGYSNDFYQANLDAVAAKQAFKVQMVLPAQGAVLSLDNMVIHKSAPNPDLAHAFIDFMLDGKNAAELSNLIGSGNVNATALEFVKPEVKALAAVFPDTERMKTLKMLTALPSELRQERGRLWTEVKVR